MGRSLMLVLAAALAVGVFAPAAFAQDDNPRGDDLGRDDSNRRYEGVYIYDDDPTGDDVVATPTATSTPASSATSTPSTTPTSTSTPTASATPSATVTSGGGVSASPRADASALPGSGGVPVLSVALGLLLVGAGIVAAMLLRRSS
jgi:cytoskeletal protein RodZ